MAIQSWEIQLEIKGNEKQFEVPTFEAAQALVRKVHAAMLAKDTLPKDDLNFIITSIDKATAPRAAQLGGWAAASYAPHWRIAILPNALGSTLAELQSAV